MRPLLLYLSEANLADRLTLRDVYAGAAKLGQRHPLVVLHANLGDAAQTRFVTKRISAQLSEAMLATTALDGGARGLLQATPDGVQVQGTQLLALLTHLQGLVLNAVLGQDHLHNAEAVLLALRRQVDWADLLLLPDNPLSPLGNPPRLLRQPSDLAPLQSAYAEETATLARAGWLLPATVLAPTALGTLAVEA